MGTRLAIGMDSNDGSSYARFILVKILMSDMSIKDILVGVPTTMSTSFMVKYSLVAIENSVINLILDLVLFIPYLFLVLV